jgi:hypothetical protein
MWERCYRIETCSIKDPVSLLKMTKTFQLSEGEETSAYQDVVGPCLQLTTPQSTKDHVASAIVAQNCGVDTVCARDRCWLGLEFSVWLVGFGHADPENAFWVLGGEEQVVHAIFLGRVRSPQLLLGPRNVGEVQKLVSC